MMGKDLEIVEEKPPALFLSGQLFLSDAAAPTAPVAVSASAATAAHVLKPFRPVVSCTFAVFSEFPVQFFLSLTLHLVL